MHRGRAIVLSLGNYAFGTPGRFSARRSRMLDLGLLALAHAPLRAAAPRSIGLELVPMAVHNERVRFRPEPLAGDELAAALDKLRDASRACGADVRSENPRRRHAGRVRAIDPDWFLYLAGFSMVILGVLQLVHRPHKKAPPSPSASSTSAPSGRCAASPSASALLLWRSATGRVRSASPRPPPKKVPRYH